MTYQPGCFGSVILYDLTYTRCKVCPLSPQCGEETLRTRALLDAEFAKQGAGGKVSLVERRKSEKRAVKQALVASVPPASEPQPVEVPVVQASVASTVVVRETISSVIVDGIEVDLVGLPKKVVETLTKWAAANLPVRALLSGQNPFVGTNFTIHADVCGFLVDRKQCDRQEIKLMLMEKRGHSDGTATSQTKIVLDSLHALGLINQNGTVATLRGA